jgi:hypothetical protein
MHSAFMLLAQPGLLSVPVYGVSTTNKIFGIGTEQSARHVYVPNASWYS